MLLKTTLVLLLLIAIGSLFSALKCLLRREDQAREDMAKALTWRFGLCFMVFVVLIAAYYLGWIKPHGLPVLN